MWPPGGHFRAEEASPENMSKQQSAVSLPAYEETKEFQTHPQ